MADDTPDAPRPLPPRPTVLVVEDDALVALLVADTLAGAGYRLAWSPDGAAPARGAIPQAAVMGLRLAGSADGREVVRALRERRSGLPVVVVTGFHLDLLPASTCGRSR